MTWKHVYDAAKISGLKKKDAGLMAVTAGYKFFAFNGVVYFVTPVGDVSTSVEQSAEAQTDLRKTEILIFVTGLSVYDLEGGR